MVGARPRPWEPQRIWPTGEYTLLADSHTAENGLTYSQGETLALSEKEATRLGTAGAIAPPDSMHAVRARTESGRGTMRDGYLYQMWTLTGTCRTEGDFRPSTFFSVSLRHGRGCSVRTSAGCWLPCCCLPPTPGLCSRTTPSLGLRTGRTFRGLASTHTSSPKKRAAGYQPAPSGPNVLCLGFARPGFRLPRSRMPNAR